MHILSLMKVLWMGYIVSFTICLLSKITDCSMHNNVAVLPPSLTVF